MRISCTPDRYLQQSLSEAYGEFPIVDVRAIGRDYTTHFMMVQAPGAGFAKGMKMVLRTIARINVKTGKAEYHTGQNEVIFQEPIFIPCAPDAPEADGYLAFVITHIDEQQLSKLWLVDTARFSQPPVAKVKLPVRLRPGLHGAWYDRSVIEAQCAISTARQQRQAGG